jgi:hypothetical protein
MRTSKRKNEANDATLTGHSRKILLGMTLGAGIGMMGLAGCHSNTATTTNPDGTTASTDPNAVDPTAANSAPVDNSTQVAGVQQSAEPTQQAYSNAAPAPVERRAPSSSSSSASQSSGSQTSSDQGYAAPAPSQGYDNSQDYNAEQGYDATLSDVQAPQPPPPLPEYAQPPAPDPNYIWTPGYWNYAPQGYYWVPGAWTQPPYTGALWTPGYWGGYGSGYRFHHGFWAAHIGFYGGINYGFGYVGVGYQGGYWNGPRFVYNQYANNINININPGFREAVYQRNVVVNNTVINNRVVNNTVYNTTTINNTRINTVSYNGGRGGVAVQPRPAELAVLREQRTPPMQAQVQVARASASNPQQFYAHNQGRPAEVAAARPLAADRGIVAPAHTTAQINRAAPIQEQQRQQQEAFRPAAQPVRPAANEAMRPAANEAMRPAPAAARPNQPEARPAPAARPAPEARPAPAAHPQPEARPAPAAHPTPARPQPEARPAPVARPAPAARPAPEARPAPAAHPQPAARPQPQARPAPQAHPAPAARPAPQAHPQPRPENRPEKKPEEHK